MGPAKIKSRKIGLYLSEQECLLYLEKDESYKLLFEALECKRSDTLNDGVTVCHSLFRGWVAKINELNVDNITDRHGALYAKEVVELTSGEVLEYIYIQLIVYKVGSQNFLFTSESRRQIQ